MIHLRRRSFHLLDIHVGYQPTLEYDLRLFQTNFELKVDPKVTPE